MISSPIEKIELKKTEKGLEISEFPKNFELTLSKLPEKLFKIKNTGNGTLHNVSLKISGLPAGSYTIIPKKYGIINSNETETFKITFNKSMKPKDYGIKFIVTSEEGTKQENSVLMVKKQKNVLIEKPLKTKKSLKISQVWIITGIAILIIIIILIIILLGLRKKNKQWNPKEDVLKLNDKMHFN